VSSQHKKIEDIEALRGLSIVFVLLAHIRILPYVEGSAIMGIYRHFSFSIGVDIFFVISGFVICRSLVSQLSQTETPKFQTIKKFWIRRIFRLLPTAWLWLIITFIITSLFYIWTGNSVQFSLNVKHVLAAFFNVVNAYSPYCWQNCETLEFGSVFVGHYWSLSLEEQFYLIFPLLLFCLNRSFFIAVLCAAILILFAWPRPLFVSYGSYFRIDGLCWGVLLGFAANTHLYANIQKRLTSRPLLILAAAILIILIPYTARHTTEFGADFHRTGFGLVALLSAGLVFIATLNKNLFTSDTIVSRFLRRLGTYSYSLYVIHLILFVTVIELFKQLDLWTIGQSYPLFYGLTACAVMIGISGVLSHLNYKYIETPWRNKGYEIAQRAKRADAEI